MYLFISFLTTLRRTIRSKESTEKGKPHETSTNSANGQTLRVCPEAQPPSFRGDNHANEGAAGKEDASGHGGSESRLVPLFTTDESLNCLEQPICKQAAIAYKGSNRKEEKEKDNAAFAIGELCELVLPIAFRLCRHHAAMRIQELDHILIAARAWTATDTCGLPLGQALAMKGVVAARIGQSSLQRRHGLEANAALVVSVVRRRRLVTVDRHGGCSRHHHHHHEGGLKRWTAAGRCLCFVKQGDCAKHSCRSDHMVAKRAVRVILVPVRLYFCHTETQQHTRQMCSHAIFAFTSSNINKLNVSAITKSRSLFCPSLSEAAIYSNC